MERLGLLRSGLVSDHALQRAARRHDLPAVRPDRHAEAADADDRARHGDSVEAWIGAAWLTGGWAAAAEAVTLVVLPKVAWPQLLVDAACPLELDEAPVAVRDAAARVGWLPRDATWLSLLVAPIPLRRRLVTAGASAVEMAAAHGLYGAHPREDQGQLTRRRSALTSGERLSERAGRLIPSMAGFKATDRLLLAIVGGALLEGGPTAGTRVGASILGE